MKTVIFRCDASKEIGNGHVMRCLNLAKGLKKEGFNPIFISQKLDGDLINLIKKDFKVIIISNKLKSSKNQLDDPNDNKYFNWLGRSQKEDADFLLDYLLSNPLIKISWIVIDHYAIDIKWEVYIKNKLSNNKVSNPRILVIDDLANRDHECDLLLDQNYFHENYQNIYKRLVPKNTELLLGTKYALIGEEYLKYKKREIIKNLTKKVLIYLGGLEHNIHEIIINSIKSEELSDLTFNYVISPKSKYFKYLRNCEKKLNNLNVHKTQRSLAPFIYESDISIGAGGSTSLERLCLNLPSLVIVMAENQNQISKDLHRNKYIFLIGNYKNINNEKIINSIIKAKNNNLKLKNGSKIVDGLGVQRLVEKMIR